MRQLRADLIRAILTTTQSRIFYFLICYPETWMSESVQNYDFASSFLWVWNFVCRSKGRSLAQDMREPRSEENVLILGGTNRRMENPAFFINCALYENLTPLSHLYFWSPPLVYIYISFRFSSLLYFISLLRLISFFSLPSIPSRCPQMQLKEIALQS
jgi:hypothetical protein